MKIYSLHTKGQMDLNIQHFQKPTISIDNMASWPKSMVRDIGGRLFCFYLLLTFYNSTILLLTIYNSTICNVFVAGRFHFTLLQSPSVWPVSSWANYFAIWEVAAGSRQMQMRPRAVLTKYSPALSTNIDELLLIRILTDLSSRP